MRSFRRTCRFTLFSTAIALGLGIAPGAGATVYSLDVAPSGSPGSGTAGYVYLTQTDGNDIGVLVSLVTGAAFVNTGNHTPFAFSIDAAKQALTTVTLVAPSPPFLWNGGASAPGTPFGTFNEGIVYCATCGNGGSHANPGPLSFTIHNDNGILLTDLTTSAGKNAATDYIFAADVCFPAVFGTSSCTGSIAANRTTSIDQNPPPPPPIPEPASMALLALGLFGLALARHARA